MSAFDIWLTILLLAVAVILTRCSLFMLGHRVKLPPRLQHALRYAPAAALAALVSPSHDNENACAGVLASMRKPAKAH